MRLTVLGCSGSGPGPTSPASGYLVRAGDVQLTLDLGNGTFGALQRHLDPWALSAVVFSHLHPDHCSDFASLAVHRRYHPRPAYDPAARPLPVLAPGEAPTPVHRRVRHLRGGARRDRHDRHLHLPPVVRRRQRRARGRHGGGAGGRPPLRGVRGAGGARRPQPRLLRRHRAVRRARRGRPRRRRAAVRGHLAARHGVVGRAADRHPPVRTAGRRARGGRGRRPPADHPRACVVRRPGAARGGEGGLRRAGRAGGAGRHVRGRNSPHSLSG